MLRFALLLAALPVVVVSQEPTRGVGVYPGRVSECASPLLQPAPAGRRNLALRRPAFASSSYDYNLTPQLVTDGIVAKDLPTWISFATSEHGTLKKHQRERLFDGNWVTDLEIKGSALQPPEAPAPWIRLDVGGRTPEVDTLELNGRVRAAGTGPENWTCEILGTDDGRTWRRLGTASGMTHVGGEFRARVAFADPARCSAYRIDLVDPRAHLWTLQEWTFSRGGQAVPVAGPHRFTSAWKPAGTRQEWIYVDLGSPSRIDRVVLDWLRRPIAGVVQVSADARAWKTMASLPVLGERNELPLAASKVRYVRVLMECAAAPEGAQLTEFEVWGQGGLAPMPRSQPKPDAEGNLELTGGAWKVARASQVADDGRTLSIPGFQDSAWLPATVPGTVLASYLNAGAIADPDFGDQQNLVSDAYFHADFWYRNTFTAPSRKSGERQWLCFDGVNWKAEVHLNGQRVGRIDGAFSRRRFDVTDLLRPGQPNALAVRVEKNAHPGAVKEKTFEAPGENGGVLGRDNPTFHASIGWDWIPTIRGRNTGIWNRVILRTTGSVTLERPAVTTRLPLPDTSTADVQIAVSLRHHGEDAVKGRLVGRFGEVSFEQPVELGKGGVTTVKVDPATHPALRLQKPRLWWPNGYGEQNLYAVELSFVPEGSDRTSDTCRFQSGVRQFSASPEGHPLQLWVNGRRFVPKGGNWGFSESMLRYRAREYDAALRYHKDMHFNMVRNWLGMVGDDAFYEACDRHGIVVWQDFWLANPWDGDDPKDFSLFMANAAELVERVRTHPCIGMYCGRNEGYPPKPIEDGVRALLAKEHPGMTFVPSSADGVVGGYGPYQVQPLETYGTKHAKTRLHSEMGMPNVPTLESLRAMMPEADLWPLGRMWGMHDFCLSGAQGAASFLDSLRKSYGYAADVAEWNDQAQFLNYDGYRAMYEGQNERRQGLLIWMSHPAWPSMVWQTYDWYLEPTAGYFGAKKACEPLHIQWHAASDKVEVVNVSAGPQKGLTARAQLYNLDGTLVWEHAATLDSAEDSTDALYSIGRPLNLEPAYLLRLRLERGSEVLSTNDYLRGREEIDTQVVRNLPKAVVTLEQHVERVGDGWVLKAAVKNTSSTPALLVNLSVRRQKSGDRILPALFSDNYVTLLPGERRELRVDVRHEDTRGETPTLLLRGYNLSPR